MRVLVLFLFLIYSGRSLACECNVYPFIKDKSQSELKLEDSFENSDIIFFGKYIGDGKFELLELYRGKNLVSEQNIIEEKEEVYNCDYSFRVSKTYLVFGNIDEQGKLWTSICVSNTIINDRSELSFVKNYLAY